MRSSVVLPEPAAPTMPKSSPLSTVKLTSATASAVANRRPALSTRIAGPVEPAAAAGADRFSAQGGGSGSAPRTRSSRRAGAGSLAPRSARRWSPTSFSAGSTRNRTRSGSIRTSRTRRLERSRAASARRVAPTARIDRADQGEAAQSSAGTPSNTTRPFIRRIARSNCSASSRELVLQMTVVPSAASKRAMRSSSSCVGASSSSAGSSSRRRRGRSIRAQARASFWRAPFASERTRDPATSSRPARRRRGGDALAPHVLAGVAHRRVQVQMLEHGEIEREPESLRNVSGDRLDRSGLAHRVVAEDRDRAGLRPDEAGDEAEEGGLAASRRTGQGDRSPGLDRRADVVEHDALASRRPTPCSSTAAVRVTRPLGAARS